MSRRKVVATIAALDQATRKGEQIASSLSGDLDRVAHGSATASSQKLFGVIGAGLGATSAIGLALITGVSAAIAAPVFMTLGGAAGVLFWRGRRGIRFEKEMHYRVTMLDTIKTQIAGLPPNAPRAIKEGLWAEYQAIMHGYSTSSIAALGPPQAAIALPPPQPHSDSRASSKADYAESGVVEGRLLAPNPGPQGDA